MIDLVNEFLGLIPFSEDMTLIAFLQNMLSVFVGLILFLIVVKMIFALIKTFTDWHNWKV